MASFQKYKTKDGYKWLFKARTTIDPKTGKKKQTTKRGFNTKKEAQMAAAELEKKLYTGTFVEETNITFESFIPVFLKEYSKRAKVSSVRIREKESKILNKYLANIKLKDVTRLKYQTILNNLTEEGYAYNTMDGVHSTGRMLFKKAIELNLITRNPTEHTSLIKKIETVDELEKKKKDIKYLEKEELANFLLTTKTKGLNNDYVFFTLLAYTGMRSGELLALKWSDIDFRKLTISITKTMYNPSNNENYMLLTPKTKGSIREIKIDNFIVNLLKDHLLQQRKIGDFQFVISKEDGYPEVPHTPGRRMRRLLKLSFIEKNVTPHSLRHTHTSLLIEAGVGIKEIQQRLGHTDIETTMNIYAHMTKDMEEIASQKFSDLMSSFMK